MSAMIILGSRDQYASAAPRSKVANWIRIAKACASGRKRYEESPGSSTASSTTASVIAL
jgi:hypothetical protein